MAQATLTITMPEQVWMWQVSTAFPETTFRMLEAVPGAGSGFALVRLTGSEVAEAVDELDDHPQISNLSTVGRTDDERTVHFDTTAPLLLFSSREAGTPIDLPVEIQDGEAVVDVTGSREQLAALADRLEQVGLRYRIERVQEQLYESQLLSERQLEVAVTAVDEGYYDTPRRCSLTELADHLGIAKSTCSETLHRAEEAIVKRFVEEFPDGRSESLEDQLVSD
ncbi:helix-turn-helix domain-containing protein [Natronococcus pandeyae]|uniref:Helix-turn-helix domain-containing protein n=1 Tax=Natronococcus pandeyae TaxID=2055836 RepID=A0A8J8PY89_9EURY|nr:helix-turn-helix domain-containing protein [Natronococcus pandeyae]TYL37061.1 helix-turn-helix domain-containing protein [Natronococcus pandeyae]